jgi:hypothetical protein
MPFITTKQGRVNIAHIVRYDSAREGSLIILSTTAGLPGMEFFTVESPAELDALIATAVTADAFALEVLRQEIYDGQVRSCRVCGCTDDHACEGGCSWVEPDLCSACAEATAIPAGIPFDSTKGGVMVLDYMPEAEDLRWRGELFTAQRRWQMAAHTYAGALIFAARHGGASFTTFPPRATDRYRLESAQLADPAEGADV